MARPHSHKPSVRRKKSSQPPADGTLNSDFGSQFLWWGVVAGATLLLPYLFWWPLWNGGGLIGGDLYPYYFPQKTYLSDHLQQGKIPLWNQLVGFGYPILGESQTAALYPPNLLLFRLFEVNTAYNLSQLGHYILALLGAICLMRRLGIGPAGSLLAAVAFIYGWFPARICLEWAIIGGMWFVWILWSAASFLQTGNRKYLLLTALFLSVDLLAGHYHLAFITLLTLIPLPWLIPLDGSTTGSIQDEQQPVTAGEQPKRAVNPLHTRVIWVWAAVSIGFLLAAVQLLPTWELKSLSQRQSVNKAFSPAYGQMPWQAISQLWIPWRWYAGEKSFDEQLSACRWLVVPAATNQAEAQLYVGMLPFLLMLGSLLVPQLTRNSRLQHRWGWLCVAGTFLILATGWPTHIFTSIPGLNFFRGAGRYSMPAAFILCLLAGNALDAAIRWRGWGRGPAVIVTAALLIFTTGDLWSASRQYQFGSPLFFGRQIFYATMIDSPPIKFREESTLRKFFQNAGPQARLYAPGQNIPTILGISSLPVYLGLGPEFYESDQLKFDFSTSNPEKIRESEQRLRRFGITHLLLESPLKLESWNVEYLGPVSDALLNRALARREPYYFYAVKNSPGRLSIEPLLKSDGTPQAAAKETLGNRIQSAVITADRVEIVVECRSECQLVLRDLDYPGWTVVKPHHSGEKFDDLYRSVVLKPEDSVEGMQTIIWHYRPQYLFWGGVLSTCGLAVMIVLVWPWPRPQRTS